MPGQFKGKKECGFQESAWNAHNCCLNTCPAATWPQTVAAPLREEKKRNRQGIETKKRLVSSKACGIHKTACLVIGGHLIERRPTKDQNASHLSSKKPHTRNIIQSSCNHEHHLLATLCNHMLTCVCSGMANKAITKRPGKSFVYSSHRDGSSSTPRSSNIRELTKCPNHTTHRLPRSPLSDMGARGSRYCQKPCNESKAYIMALPSIAVPHRPAPALQWSSKSRF
jgi:hypothetical protein